tara:strand:+ start:1497 stop:2000 length:504 start_codon:yes stop_codon:yes gene_type:complete
MNYKNKRIEELKYQAENKDLIASQKKLNSIRERLYNTYGKNRLYRLLSPELNTRMQRAKDKFDAEYNLNKVVMNNMMARAYEAIEQELIINKYAPLDKDYFYFYSDHHKQKFIICFNEDNINNAFKEFEKENVIVLTLKEMIKLINKDFIKFKRLTHTLQGTIEEWK